MPQARNQNRIKISTICVLTAFVALLFYFFYFQFNTIYKNRDEFGGRCLSELTNVKYQLENVLKYKKNMDSVINEIQRECTMQKESIQDFSDSYMFMKHHLEICEMQTEDLELQSTELKASLKKVNKELAACKKAPG